MNDESIVRLYWNRSESAITESSKKYGAYCTSIAYNILHSDDDAEECVNDTWLHAWNAMPPHRPAVLSAFLGKLTRNLSFDRYKKNRREKRGGGSLDAVLDELAECVSGEESVERSWEAKELKQEIDRFLLALPEEKRYMFILRYWYAYSIRDIADRMSVSENSVSVSLNRVRGKLKTLLHERGYDV